MALQKSTYNETAFREALIRMTRLRDYGRSNYPAGEFLLKYEVTLAAADLDLNDEVLVAKVPSVDVEAGRGVFLLGFKAKLTDVDTNGAPAHVADFMAGTNVLISGSTIGQAGGIDSLDANNAMLYEDIQGLDIKMKSTTAAATGAAGTLTVWLHVLLDRYSESGS